MTPNQKEEELHVTVVPLKDKGNPITSGDQHLLVASERTSRPSQSRKPVDGRLYYLAQLLDNRRATSYKTRHSSMPRVAGILT